MTASTTKKNTALATVLAVAAMATPASAAPIESMLPTAPGGSAQTAPTADASPTATVSSPSGFDWGDAGIGAAGTLSLLTLGAGSVLITRRGLRAPAS